MKKNILRLKNTEVIEIFSTGVVLESVECIINGQKQWRWIVTRFEDESFFDGNPINPIEYATEKDKLIEKFKD